jgi:hypothetical protein
VSAVDDLIAFLRAQLDDDERVAREAAGPGYFYAEGHSDNVWAFLERWCPDNPKFVLDDIAAKRLLLDFLDPTGAPEGEGKYVAKRAILLLALPYAGYPGWREEWAL